MHGAAILDFKVRVSEVILTWCEPSCGIFQTQILSSASWMHPERMSQYVCSCFCHWTLSLFWYFFIPLHKNKHVNPTTVSGAGLLSVLLAGRYFWMFCDIWVVSCSFVLLKLRVRHVFVCRTEEFDTDLSDVPKPPQARQNTHDNRQHTHTDMQSYVFALCVCMHILTHTYKMSTWAHTHTQHTHTHPHMYISVWSTLCVMI